MRIRQITNDASLTSDVYVVSNGTPAAPVQISFQSDSSISKYCEDVITPNFTVRRAAGEVIMNDYKSVVSELTAYAPSLHYFLRVTNDGVPVQTTEVYLIGPYSARFRKPRTPMALLSSAALSSELTGYNLPNLGAAEQRVLAKALQSASSTDALALVTMAELDKTVDLLAAGGRLALRGAVLLENLGPKRLGEFKSALRHYGQLTNKRKRQLFLRSLAGSLRSTMQAWLGYRYGIMATYYDLESWVEASSTKQRRLRFVANESDSFIDEGTWVTEYTTDFSDFKSRVFRKRRTVSSAGVLIEGTALPKSQRFGATRIFESAWELVPWSFVLDWFVDVGTRLAAWEGGLHVRPLGSWVSHEHTIEYRNSYTNDWRDWTDGPTRYWGEGNDAGTVSELCTIRERKANPSLTWLPQVSVKLNWKKLADSVALFSGASTRLVRHIRG